MDKDCLLIKEKELDESLIKADRWLVQTTYKPKKGILEDAEPAGKYSLARTDFSETEEKVSLLQFARNLSGHQALFCDEAHFFLTKIRKAIALGLKISETYSKASGLNDLLAQKKTAGGMSDAQQTEFREKFRTNSFITVFCSALYMKYELSRYRTDEVGSIDLRFDGIPEINTRSPNQALDCMVFYLGAYFEKTGRVRTGLEMIKMALLYFNAFLDECSLQVESLKFSEPYKNYRFKLEHTEFEINGFETEVGNGAVSVEFNRVKFNEMVGNRLSIHKNQRLSIIACCYDPYKKRNPMKDLGVFPILTAGFGEPGTGKGMLISATSTLLEELVPELVGIPYLFHPMPQSMVDSFQGNSGKNMHNWLKLFGDPNKIIYGPIDDAEQNLADRSRRDGSAGQMELVQEFLPRIEGPLAVFFGNAFMQVFSNLMEKLDPAVLSRIQDRLELKGAERWQDFIDMDQLWLDKFNKITSDFTKKFVNMDDPKSYKYFDAQKLIGSLKELDEIKEPENVDLRNIFNQASKQYKIKERMFFANLYELIKKKWPSFSPRDQRNIQTAINQRIFDFDFPKEWINNPSILFRVNPEKNYETKMKMIGDLMIQNMKGFAFSEVWRQEVIRYLDTWLLIREKGRERAIKDAMERMDVEIEAQKRISNM